jgi:colanic acid biosynthesis protein WcaH
VSAAFSSDLPPVKRLSQPEFDELVRLGPLVSIDLVVRDREGRVLLALRNHAPAKDTLFVPGGAILKGEPIEAAFERIVARELGLNVSYDAARLRGVYQHFYRISRSPSEPGGTHYVVLAHDVALNDDAAIKLDSSHSSYRWLTEAEILAAPDVHEYVKDYFRPARRTHYALL